MRIGILGAGAIAFGAAAQLSLSGHEPVLWSPSGAGTKQLACGEPLIASGALEASFRPRIASSCAEAIADADGVMLALPAYGHKSVIDAAAHHIRNGQPVIMSGHLSFGALYLSKRLCERNVQAPIIAWGTTVTTGRQTSATAVHVGTVRGSVDIATMPADAIDEGHALCTELFGDRFAKRDGLLAIALSNLNPQNHLGIALLNLTRMEHGESWSQGGNITPTVGRLIEALDTERLHIARALGVAVKTVQEHFALSYRVPIRSVAEMNQERHRLGLGGFGPKTIDSRYVLEDVPFGLLPTVILARLTGCDATLHEAGIAMLSAAYGREFSKENDLLPELGIERMSMAELQRLASEGYWGG
ncbi:NAD/NADP octopine/nopaline dehydrogenase family protein [Trinickia sp.]|uniref:NAD/NADP octopine/nopaline dehydrogenase family protein n=1 Tax=Trinickia sp. TaxID=2571163 RepID=UPI003F807BBE